MAASILSIIAALLPVLFEYLDRREKERPSAERQAILQEIAAGDMGALAVRIDRLRTTARVRAQRQQTL